MCHSVGGEGSVYEKGGSHFKSFEYAEIIETRHEGKRRFVAERF